MSISEMRISYDGSNLWFPTLKNMFLKKNTLINFVEIQRIQFLRWLREVQVDVILVFLTSIHFSCVKDRQKIRKWWNSRKRPLRWYICTCISTKRRSCKYLFLTKWQKLLFMCINNEIAAYWFLCEAGRTISCGWVLVWEDTTDS